MRSFIAMNEFEFRNENTLIFKILWSEIVNTKNVGMSIALIKINHFSIFLPNENET